MTADAAGLDPPPNCPVCGVHVSRRAVRENAGFCPYHDASDLSPEEPESVLSDAGLDLEAIRERSKRVTLPVTSFSRKIEDYREVDAVDFDALIARIEEQDRRIAELEQTFPWSEWYALNRKLADQQSEIANLKALLAEALDYIDTDFGADVEFSKRIAAALEPKTP